MELEESFELNPKFDEPSQILTLKTVEKDYHCVLMLDTSLSMSGNKQWLSALSICVLLLESPSSSLVTFSSKASVLRPSHSGLSVSETLKDFFKLKPSGYTNLSEALKVGVKLPRRKIGVLVTDGRVTEGGDPTLEAKKYDMLMVLHLKGSGADLNFSKKLARVGHGSCLEVTSHKQLPQVLYTAIKIISRL